MYYQAKSFVGSWEAVCIYFSGRLSGIFPWEVVCTSTSSIALHVFWLYFHQIGYLFVSRHDQLSLLSYLDFGSAWYNYLWPERGFCMIMGSSSFGTFLLGFSLPVISSWDSSSPFFKPSLRSATYRALSICQCNNVTVEAEEVWKQ